MSFGITGTKDTNSIKIKMLDTIKLGDQTFIKDRKYTLAPSVRAKLVERGFAVYVNSGDGSGSEGIPKT